MWLVVVRVGSGDVYFAMFETFARPLPIK